MLFPLLLHPIFFKKPKSFWNDEGIPNEVFQTCETKSFRKKRDTPSYATKYSVSVFFWKQKGSPTNFLGVIRHKKIFDRTVMSPPPARALLCMTSFDTRSFLKCRCVPLRDLSLVWKKVQRWMVQSSCDA